VGTALWLRTKLVQRGLRESDDAVQKMLAEAAARRHDGLPGLPGFNPDDAADCARIWQSAESAKAAVLGLLELRDGDLRQLLDAAQRQPPSVEVQSAVWLMLTESSRWGPVLRRTKAFGALFRLAPLASAAERKALRRDFLRFFRWHVLVLSKWPGWLLESADPTRSARGGAGIPWDDDELSAALSWSSEIGCETNPYRQLDSARASKGMFSYVSQAYLEWEAMSGLRGCYDIHEIVPRRGWVRQPLLAPFEPTPWQRARALHLRQPDLSFPAQMWYRPGA
jgi:hypothetical protein